jgi:hypothetical protein
MVKFNIRKLAELEKFLKEFPNIKEIQNLRKRIKSEKKKTRLVPKPEKIIPPKNGNLKRSSNMKKYHRYIRRIRDVYFPEMKYRDIQKQFKKRREEGTSSIGEAVWQNLSP